MASSGNGPTIIEFLPDLTTKKKKGVHRPVYANVFAQQVTQGDAVYARAADGFIGKAIGNDTFDKAKVAGFAETTET
ncbi:MAG: hypothetical protein VXV76_04820, partial [Candidatus Thermoplasmatota archaeon]|nr:hypothetical protein [Candidatus Thermoplasmatota archaeon]